MAGDKTIRDRRTLALGGSMTVRSRPGDGTVLTVTLPTDEQILITREFDAPKELVYKAWTTPELVKRWWNANSDFADEF